MDLSEDQKSVLGGLLSWQESSKRRQYISVGGFAGTGKTTLISVFRKELAKKNKKLKVAFASYTGKAVRVMRSKLVENKGLEENDMVSTIHGLIYSPITNEKEEIVGWKRKEEVETDLIIIDEASMVDEVVWKDLLSYGVPIAAVGDHGQLPPIRGKFNLMESPDLRLNEIHRQAVNNPIIKLSMLARERGKIPAIDFGEKVKKISKGSDEAREIVEEELMRYDRDMLVLCGYNYTRVKLNKYIRQGLGLMGLEPVSGDRVICLRNNHTAEVFNGMLGVIYKIKEKGENIYKAEIEMDGEDKMYEGNISKEQFGRNETMSFTKDRIRTKDMDLFDFGYALTVHKAQGSQAKKVILFEEKFGRMDEEEWRRWLYTGVTRAEEELLIIGE